MVKKKSRSRRDLCYAEVKHPETEKGELALMTTTMA